MSLGLLTWIIVSRYLIVACAVSEQSRNQGLAHFDIDLAGFDNFQLAAITAIRYSREEILAYRRYDVIPLRASRKAICSSQLWLPRHIRRTVECKHSRRLFKCGNNETMSSSTWTTQSLVQPSPAVSEQDTAPAVDITTALTALLVHLMPTRLDCDPSVSAY